MRPCPNSRHHGAAERLLECLHQVIPVLRRDVEAASRLGETFHIEDALRAGPTVAPQLIADDMNGEPSAVRFEELAERAGRAAAGFLAVGHQDDDAFLCPVIEDLRCLPHRCHKRRLPGRIDRVHCAHDALGRVRDRREVERDIALPIGPGAVSDEPDLAKFCDPRQHLRQGFADLVDARDVAEQALDGIAGHRPRRIEDDHRILRAWNPIFVRRLRSRRSGEECERREYKRPPAAV